MFLWNGWLGYWFRPTPLFNLALCRLVIIGLQICILLFYGTYDSLMHRALQAPTGSNSLFSPLLIWKLLTIPFGTHFIPSTEIFQVIYLVSLLTGFLAFIGYWTNTSLILFATGNIFIQSFIYSFSEIHHPEGLMMLALSILALSPCGQTLSVDDLRRRLSFASHQKQFHSFNILAHESEFSRWPLLLIQWIFALCYTSAFISKVKASGGLAWANGFTLQYYLVQDGIRFNFDAALWVAQFHYLALVLQWIVFVFQGTFFLAVLFPSIAWIYALLGISFHAGVYLIMGAPFFTWMGIYSVFFNWTSIVKNLKNRLPLAQEKLEVLYDGQCPLCIRSMTILQYFDWFEKITFSEVQTRWENLSVQHKTAFSLSDCLREMYLLTHDGTYQKGFWAFRAMLRYMPLLWPFLLFFYLPLASIVGPKLYQFVATRRARFTQCSSGTCAVHTSPSR